jgi:hypothetical protein
MNMYAYVGGDPVNRRDPSGMCGAGEVPLAVARTHRPEGDVVALYRIVCVKMVDSEGLSGGSSAGGGEGGAGEAPEQEIVVTASLTDNPCGSEASVYRIADTRQFWSRGVMGETLGLPPLRLQGNRINSSFYGTNEQLMSYFYFLSGAADDIFVWPSLFGGTTLTSLPSRITYRVGDTGLGRIDVPANTFKLNRHETIHVSKQCPLR